MCVIADDRAVLGFGGILGGEDTGCTHDDQERADRVRLLRPAAHGRHGPQGRHRQSDARYRFERGVDPAFILPGLDLATAMMLEVGGRNAVQAQGSPARRRRRRPSSASSRASSRSSPASSSRRSRSAAPWKRWASPSRARARRVKVTAPSWRPDIHGAADLVEEVVRIVGLDKVPSAPMPRSRGVARAVLTETPAPRAPGAPRLWRRAGWSRPSPGRSSRAPRRGPSAAARTRWSSPIRSRREMSSMRPSLLPGLLAAVQRNRNRGFADLGAVRGGAGLSRRRARGPVSSPPPACAPAPRRSPAPAAIGRGRRRRPASTTPRRTWRRCWPSSASMPPRRR